MRLLGKRSFPLGFSLLAKELVEQAARRRTYIIRVVYASFLFFLFAWFAYEELAGYENDPFRLLGKGEDLFTFLVAIQFVGIYLFLPAMVSRVITYEKERRSLELLFLTDLRPWEILLQKMFGRLIPMFTFLLLTLPLMGIAYALGGLSADYLATGTYLLFLTCFQVGAVALMASSYFRTTGKAYIASCGILLVLYFGIVTAYGILQMLDVIDVHFWRHEKYMFCLIPPYLFAEAGRKGFSDILLRSIPVILSVLAFLLLARVFLIRRAFIPVRDSVLRTFKRLDRVMFWLNRFVGGIVLVKDKKTLPVYEPIAWRETTRKSLGKFRYLLRVLVLLEIPVLFICVMCLAASASRTWRGQADEISAVVFFLWAIAILTVCAKSANLIASERSNQTLEVLLTTPISGRDIIRQKMRSVWRLMFVLMVPFVTCFITEAWWEGSVTSGYSYWGGYRRGIGPAGYMVASLLSIIIFLPMFAWVSLWVGLKVRSQRRAIATTLAVIVGWIVGPFLLLVLIDAFWHFYGPSLPSFFLIFSPVTAMIIAETGEFPGGIPVGIAIFLSFLLHVGVLFFFRWLCLKKADRYLGRVYHKPAPR